MILPCWRASSPRLFTGLPVRLAVNTGKVDGTRPKALMILPCWRASSPRLFTGLPVRLAVNTGKVDSVMMY